MLLAIIVCSLSGAASQSMGQVEATSSKAARMEALRNIPFNEFTRDASAKLTPVLDRPSIYRRLPVETIECDPDLHVFLVRYPEVIVGIWQMMGITKVSSERVGDFVLKASDGEGTVSNVELVYGTPGLYIYYAEGTYDGPLFHNKINGRCVLVLRSEYGVDTKGNPVVRNQLDTFVKIDNLAANLVAKTFSPIFSNAADHNFVETSRFLSRINEAAAKNSYGVKAMADQMENVSPEVKDKFGRIATVVEDRADHRLRTTVTARN